MVRVAVLLAAACSDPIEPAATIPGLVSLDIVAGDNQSAVVAGLVPVAPVVIVTDSNGPAAGVPVTFSVMEGGGQITGGLDTTDANGHATVTSWQLGASPGLNRLRASVPGLTAVEFHATAILPSPAVSVQIVTPSVTDTLKAGDFVVEANVQASEALASVTARIGATQRPLQYAGGTMWRDSFLVAGVPSGAHILEVTATTVGTAINAAQRSIRLDRPPAIAVTAPITGAVVRTTLDYQANCLDETPGTCQIEFLVRPVGAPTLTPIASGFGTLTGSTPVTQWDGQSVEAWFRVRDALGREVEAARVVQVNQTPGLIPLLTVAGPVVDVAGSRVLYTAVDTVTEFRLRDTTTAVDVAVDGGHTELNDGPNKTGFVTSGGALFLSWRSQPVSRGTLQLWRNGQHAIVRDVSLSDFDTEGVYATYRIPFGALLPPFSYQLDLTTGVETPTPGAGDQLPDGSVLYESGQIYRWVAGASTPLITVPAPPNVFYYRPRSDGTKVVVVIDDRTTGTSDYRLGIIDATGAAVSITASLGSTFPVFQLSGGWVAYERPDALGVRQIRRRDPPGNDTQLSNVAASATLEGVGSDGSVLFSSAGTGTNRYYLVVGAGTSATNIADRVGRPVWRTDRFFVLFGNTVFGIAP